MVSAMAERESCVGNFAGNIDPKRPTAYYDHHRHAPLADSSSAALARIIFNDPYLVFRQFGRKCQDRRRWRLTQYGYLCRSAWYCGSILYLRKDTGRARRESVANPSLARVDHRAIDTSFIFDSLALFIPEI